MTSSRTPPLLAPHVAVPPPSSLTLVTGVLSATTNWLVLRFLDAALVSPVHDGSKGVSITTMGDEQVEEDDEVTVVLVSFLRDWIFWKGEGMRMGIDFARLLENGRITFVDGLSSLFRTSDTPHTMDLKVDGGQGVLHDPTLGVVERKVLDAIEYAKTAKSTPRRKRTLLFLDGLDLYLSATESSAQQVNDMLGEWKEHVYATIIATAADSPLMQTPCTPVATAHKSFVAGLAHEARLVISVRGLDTGMARDVSGVIRITKADGWLKVNEHIQESARGKAEALKEKEMLFFMGGDGMIKVWERGALA